MPILDNIKINRINGIEFDLDKEGTPTGTYKEPNEVVSFEFHF